MTGRFRDEVVVIVGATGGLGFAFARAFADAGARLVLSGRDAGRLSSISAALGGDALTYMVELTDPTSVVALGDYVDTTCGQVDVVVNVTGVDVRKPFTGHDLADIRRTLDVNLAGAILLTHTFLGIMQGQGDGTIVHVGGFADGRLAFPYYSVDVATRAGLFSFVESLNRELMLEGSPVVVSYFSPSPADTEAERPYHPIWRKMGTRIVPQKQVAAALLDAIVGQRRVHVMGGPATVLFAKLNSVWPCLADALLLRRYGKILKQYFA